MYLLRRYYLFGALKTVSTDICVNKESMVTVTEAP